MSVDPELAGLVRGAIAELAVANVSEMRMFGGIGFMLNGNLLVGASSRGLLVRVGRQAQGEARARWRCAAAGWRATSTPILRS
jgi:hypothetical protein